MILNIISVLSRCWKTLDWASRDSAHPSSVRVFKKISAIANPAAISILEIRAKETMSQSSSVKEVLVADSATNKHVAIGMEVDDKLARAVSLSSRQKIHFLLGLSARCTYSTMNGPRAGIEIFFKKSFPDIENFSCAFTNHPIAPNPV